MSQVKFYSGTSEKINQKSIENGALYVATDTKELFVDLDNTRIAIGSGKDFEIIRTSKNIEETTKIISIPEIFSNDNNINLQVYQNGLLLVEGVHYTISDGSINLLDYYAVSGDIFEFMGQTTELPVSLNTYASEVLVGSDFGGLTNVEQVLKSIYLPTQDLNSSISALENLTQQHSDKISTIEQETDSNSELIIQQGSSIGLVKESVNQNTSSISEIKSDIQKINTNLEDLSLKNSNNSNAIQSLETNVETHNNKISTIEENILDQENKITQATSSAKNAVEKVNSVSNTVEDHTKSITTLKQTDNSHNIAISNLQSGLQQVSIDITSVENIATETANSIKSLENSKINKITINGIDYVPVNGNIALPQNFMQTNVAQTMTEKLVAKAGTDYTTKQVRNITISTSEPSGGSSGDIWFVREA